MEKVDISKKYMLHEIIKLVNNRFGDKEIAHMNSIILRMWYEYINMKMDNQDLKINLKQMDNFEIMYNNNIFTLKFFQIIIKINEKQLSFLVNQIYEYFEKKYPVDFNYKLINPIYFSLFFYDLLDKIIKVKYDNINISEIKLLRENSVAVNIEESERYKALLDKNYKMYSPFPSNLKIDTPRRRLEKNLKYILQKGYGYNNEYAIFYNNEPYLRDGQHRVAILKYFYGNIDIKIVRFYLKDNYFYS